MEVSSNRKVTTDPRRISSHDMGNAPVKHATSVLAIYSTLIQCHIISQSSESTSVRRSSQIP